MLLGRCDWARNTFLQIGVLLDQLAHRRDQGFFSELLIARESVQDLCETVDVSSLENNILA